jgi:hypothetical protein
MLRRDRRYPAYIRAVIELNLRQKRRDRIVENRRRRIERLMQRLLNRDNLCRYSPAFLFQRYLS